MVANGTKECTFCVENGTQNYVFDSYEEMAKLCDVMSIKEWIMANECVFFEHARRQQAVVVERIIRNYAAICM